MCGIGGEIRWDGQLADVQYMMPHLRRRGPNGDGIWTNSIIAMAHSRLAVIDPFAQSNQPFVDEQSGLVMVFNGTLYNYQNLRQELQGLGYTFRSNGDTEVLLKAYHAWGEYCLQRLDGMFALAIWNIKEEVLFLARDHVGIKPLYFSHQDNIFRFASNTQALISSGIDKSLNPMGLHHFFMLHGAVPAPHTLYKNIKKLPPASWMKVSGQGEVFGPVVYWQLPAHPQNSSEDLRDFKQSLDAAIIREYQVSDVPVGVLLSGGLDSSYMVGVLHAHGVRQLPSFTIGFESHVYERGDEFQYSDWIASRYQTHHQRWMISNEDFVKQLPDVIQSMSEPLLSQDALGFYVLAKMVHQAGLKVVLSGQGADELLGGYSFYSNMLSDSGTALERVQKHYLEISDAQLRQHLSAEFLPETDVTSQWMGEALLDDDDFMYSFLRLDVSQLIVDDPVRRVDNMTMAWGVEARVPFLSRAVIEKGMAISTAFKMQGLGKWPLKKIAADYFPAEFIHRPKGAFPVPVVKFIEEPLRSMIRDVLNSKACQERGVFQRAVIADLIQSPNSQYTPLAFNRFWLYGLLEFWLQSH